MSITGKTWHPRIVELLKGINEGRVPYDLDQVAFESFCSDYLCAIDHNFTNVIEKIQIRLLDLHKGIYIVPTGLLTDKLNAAMFSRPFALKVWQTTPATVNHLILDCREHFPPSFGILIALVESVAFGKYDVANLLEEKVVKRVSTLNAILPCLFKNISANSAVVERLSELATYVKTIPLVEDFEVQEDIEKHEELNPKLFDGNKLKPEIREKAIEIADELMKTLQEAEVPFKLKDLVLTGSNASYNYTKDSDVDIHLVADMSGIEDPDNIYPALFNAYKSAFNNKYNIAFYGVPVEVYIESADTAVVSNGIYSILQDTWIKEPKNESIPDIDLNEVDEAVASWETKYRELIKSLDGPNSIDETPIDKFVDDLYEIRAKGLSGDGEYSLENLIFKEMRNKGYLEKLKDLRAKVVEQRLSIKNIKEAYLDSEQKFWDFGTADVTDTDKIDTTIGSSFGAKDLLAGNTNYPDLVYDIVPMTADQYFKLCSLIQRESPETLKSWIAADKYKLDHLEQVLDKYHKQFPMPYVCLDPDSELFGQEGRHRMYLLGQKYGWNTKFPVQVIQNKYNRKPITKYLGETLRSQEDKDLYDLEKFAGLI